MAQRFKRAVGLLEANALATVPYVMIGAWKTIVQLMPFWICDFRLLKCCN